MDVLVLWVSWRWNAANKFYMVNFKTILQIIVNNHSHFINFGGGRNNINCTLLSYQGPSSWFYDRVYIRLVCSFVRLLLSHHSTNNMLRLQEWQRYCRVEEGHSHKTHTMGLLGSLLASAWCHKAQDRSRKFHSTCERMCPHTPDIQDIVQATYIYLWLNCALDDDDRPRTRNRGCWPITRWSLTVQSGTRASPPFQRINVAGVLFV